MLGQEWRLAPESFVGHGHDLRRLAAELQKIGFPFALTSRNLQRFVVFVVVDCTPLEQDAVTAQLDERDLGAITSVITLPGYRAMMPHLGNDQPWILFDPQSLLESPGAGRASLATDEQSHRGAA